MPDALPSDLADALRAVGARRGPFGDPAYYFHETTSTNDVAACVRRARRARGHDGHRRRADVGARAPREDLVLAAWRRPVLLGHRSCGARRAVSDARRWRRGGRRRARGHGPAARDQVAERRRHPREPSGCRAGASSPACWRRPRRQPTGCSTSSWASGSTSARPAYPPELADRASSIETELGRAVEPGVVLAEVLAALAAELEPIARGDARASWRGGGAWRRRRLARPSNATRRSGARAESRRESPTMAPCSSEWGIGWSASSRVR